MISDEKLHLHISKFAIIGLLATCIHAGLFWLLYEKLSILSQASNFSGWVIAAAFSYSGQRHWTFKNINVRSEKSAKIKFLTSSLASLTLNASFTHIFTAVYHNTYLVMACMLLVTPAITFLLMKFWVFVDHEKPSH